MTHDPSKFDLDPRHYIIMPGRSPQFLAIMHYNKCIMNTSLCVITNLPHIVYAYRLVSVQSIHGDHCSLNKIVFADIHKENWFPPLDVIKTSKENFTFFYNFVFRDYCLFSTNFWISYQTSVNTFPSVSITFFSRKRASHLIATMTSSRSNITCWLRFTAVKIAGTALKWVF